MLANVRAPTCDCSYRSPLRGIGTSIFSPPSLGGLGASQTVLSVQLRPDGMCDVWVAGTPTEVYPGGAPEYAGIYPCPGSMAPPPSAPPLSTPSLAPAPAPSPVTAKPVSSTTPGAVTTQGGAAVITGPGDVVTTLDTAGATTLGPETLGPGTPAPAGKGGLLLTLALIGGALALGG